MWTNIVLWMADVYLHSLSKQQHMVEILRDRTVRILAVRDAIVALPNSAHENLENVCKFQSCMVLLIRCFVRSGMRPGDNILRR